MFSRSLSNTRAIKLSPASIPGSRIVEANTLNIPAHQKKIHCGPNFCPIPVYSVDMWPCYDLPVAQIQQTEMDRSTATIPCGVWAR